MVYVQSRNYADTIHDIITKEMDSLLNDPRSEIYDQINWLEQSISDIKAHYQVLSRQHGELERAIHCFLTDYYQSVGGLTSTLEALDAQVAQMGIMAPAEERADAQLQAEDIHIIQAVQLSPPRKAAEANMTPLRLKQLYRKLAKRMHPDTAQSHPQAQDLFAQLNLAYKHHDLTTMLKLEQEMALFAQRVKESEVQKLERLEKEYDSWQCDADDLKMRHHVLKQSPEYKLYQRAQWHKMCGENLITKVMTQLEKEIRRKQAILTRFQQQGELCS